MGAARNWRRQRREPWLVLQAIHALNCRVSVSGLLSTAGRTALRRGPTLPISLQPHLRRTAEVVRSSGVRVGTKGQSPVGDLAPPSPPAAM